MAERQEVERMLRRAEGVNEVGVMPFGAADVAALCRAWLAADEAEICTVVDSGWYESGAIYDVSPELVGQRVRIVPAEGDQ